MNDDSVPQTPRPKRRITIAGLVTLGLVSSGVAVATAATTSGGGSSPAGGSATAPAAARSTGPLGPTPSAYDTDGTVTAVSSTGLTVRDAFGSSRTYAISGSTTVHEGPASSKAAALATGEHVHVRGNKSGGTLEAVDVDVRQAHISGTVTAVDGSSITVSDPDGFTRRIDVGSGTTYTKDGAKATLSAVRSGVVVQAAGRVDQDKTSLDADTVAVYTSAAALPAGPGAPAGKGAPAGGPGPLGPVPAPPSGGGTGRSGSGPAGAPSVPSGVASAPSSPSPATSHGS